jgi:CBS domain-containing protein
MKASEVMTSPVVAVRADASVDEAARLIARHGVNSLPVTDSHGRLLGQISESDVFRAIALRAGIGLSPTARLDERHMAPQVADVAQPVTPSVRPRDDMSLCLALMVRDNTTSVSVVDGGRVVGIITRREALRVLATTEIDDSTRMARASGRCLAVTP